MGTIHISHLKTPHSYTAFPLRAWPVTQAQPPVKAPTRVQNSEWLLDAETFNVWSIPLVHASLSWHSRNQSRDGDSPQETDLSSEPSWPPVAVTWPGVWESWRRSQLLPMSGAESRMLQQSWNTDSMVICSSSSSDPSLILSAQRKNNTIYCFYSSDSLSNTY